MHAATRKKNIHEMPAYLTDPGTDHLLSEHRVDTGAERPTGTLYLTLLASCTGSLCMGTALGYSSPASISLLKAADEGRSVIHVEDIFW